ncbi:MAG TPA: VWA domain-containing protein [Terriglobales bacterium]|nr:VWA domain-containing protein [Terriglobales bacterium]
MLRGSTALGKNLILAALVVLPVIAQNAGSSRHSPQEAPVTTLRSATRQVVLDVVVTDQSGRPVSNLTRNDFTITEDKNPQIIALFERPDQHRYEISTVEDKARERERIEHSVSPALTILVIDALNTELQDTAYAREVVRKYLHTHGPRLPQPTALMVVTDSQLELIHDYTDDADLLQDALKRHAAEFPLRQGANHATPGDLDRLADTLHYLEQIAAANMNFAGRKNVIWIGHGFPAVNLAQPSLSGARGVAGPHGDLRRRLMTAVSTTANEMWDSRLAIYTIDPQGLKALGPGAMDIPSGMKAFENIAAQTGGKSFFNRNDADVALADSVDDGADYYTLSYYPTNKTWDGKFRNIQVTLARPGLEARTRSGYYAAPDLPDTDAKIDSELADAVKNPLPYRGLDITVSYKILRGTPRMTRYVVAVDRHNLGWQAVPDGDRHCNVKAVVMSVSRKDPVVENDIKALVGTVKSGKFEKEMDNPMMFTFSAELPADATRLRVVVRDDRTGNIGTADLSVGGPANDR